MPQGTVAIRDAEKVREYTADFVTRKEHFLSGSRLGAPLNENRHGGGALMYALSADHPAIESYIGSQQLTAPGFTIPGAGFTRWAATTNGGPYVHLNGTTQALYIADATWQEATTNNLLVWHIVNLQSAPSPGASMAIASKFDTNAGNRSWSLQITNAAGTLNFEWLCNPTGLGPANVVVTSSIAASTNTWYYVAGFFQASTLQRIFVGATTTNVPTPDSLVAGIPATLHNGSAPLGIGARFNTAPTLNQPWNGYIGIGGARIAIPSTNINAHVNQLFAEAQTKY
jgi:hypothetical protein